MLHVILLAQFAMAYTRSWAVDNVNGCVLLKAENYRLRHRRCLLRTGEIAQQHDSKTHGLRQGAHLRLPRFTAWSKQKGVKPLRYRVVGRHGNIVVIERMIKDDCTRRILVSVCVTNSVTRFSRSPISPMGIACIQRLPTERQTMAASDVNRLIENRESSFVFVARPSPYDKLRTLVAGYQ